MSLRNKASVHVRVSRSHNHPASIIPLTSHAHLYSALPSPWLPCRVWNTPSRPTSWHWLLILSGVLFTWISVYLPHSPCSSLHTKVTFPFKPFLIIPVTLQCPTQHSQWPLLCSVVFCSPYHLSYINHLLQVFFFFTCITPLDYKLREGRFYPFYSLLYPQH